MRNLFYLVVLGSAASGQLITPEWRGEEGKSHIEWDVFSEAKFLPNSPDVATDPDASLTSRTSSAFLTGSRNIYSFQAPISMQLDDTTGLVVRHIFLQVGTLGAGMDAAGARLIFENEQGEVQVIPPSQTFIASEEDLTGERGGVGTAYGIQ